MPLLRDTTLVQLILSEKPRICRHSTTKTIELELQTVVVVAAASAEATVAVAVGSTGHPVVVASFQVV